MRGVDLTDTDLCRSKFNGADLRDANFIGASFDETTLVRVDLRGCTGASLYNAQMLGTILPDGMVTVEKIYNWP